MQDTFSPFGSRLLSTLPRLLDLVRLALRPRQREYKALVKEYAAHLDEVEQVERDMYDERAAFEREHRER